MRNICSVFMGKFKSYTSTLIIVVGVCFIGLSSKAIFSMFVSVSPQTMESYELKVKFSKVKKGYKVKVSNITKDSGWLILMKEPLPVDKQNFRGLVWNKDFESGRMVKDISKVFSKSNKTKEVEIVVKESLIKRSYLYFDHPVEVEDGGFYYTVDLPSFYKDLTSK